VLAAFCWPAKRRLASWLIYNVNQRILMNVFSEIDRLITEHGSATILRERVALVREQNDALQKKVGELQSEVERLRASVAALEKEKAALSMPVRDLVSGELEVDGILWSYTADRATNEWPSLLPRCPHCRTQLCVEFVLSQFALTDEGGHVHFSCDNCGKFAKAFPGSRRTREDKAMRHIIQKHERG
jgi:hypothetical protein